MLVAEVRGANASPRGTRELRPSPDSGVVGFGFFSANVTVTRLPTRIRAGAAFALANAGSGLVGAGTICSAARVGVLAPASRVFAVTSTLALPPALAAGALPVTLATIAHDFPEAVRPAPGTVPAQHLLMGTRFRTRPRRRRCWK